MIQLIDKYTVKNELRHLIFVCDSVICDKDSMNKERYIERRVAYEQFYKFINSHEVENVALVTELHNFLKDRPDIGQVNDMAALEVSKHFFKLGLKTSERR